MNFASAVEYLDNLSMFGIKLGLEQPARLFELAGLDWRSIKFIHLAGTNGKGSCGAMLQQALQGAGCKVGFYTSPHLISVRERFRINGRAISEDDFARYIERISQAVELLRQEGGHATFFELTTALALAWFIDQKVDFAVWETGMGGRLDATNVVTPVVSVITNIALDHTKYLGDTLAKIAAEKAGIIKAGVPVMIGSNIPPEAEQVIRKRADELQSVCRKAENEQNLKWHCLYAQDSGTLQQQTEYAGVTVNVPLPGAMQRRNFMLAAEVLTYLSGKYGLPLKTMLDSVEKTTWPGRVQIVRPYLWVDGGHNPDGAEALVQAVKELFGEQRITVIFGAFADKDATLELQILSSVADKMIFVPIQEEFRPCHKPEALQETLKNISDLPAAVAISAAQAVQNELTAGNTVLVSGSLHLVAEVLAEHGNGEAVLNI